ncbi:MAG: NAD(P)-dependent oxidoreductase [Planctomycetaceae bacterium]
MSKETCVEPVGSAPSLRQVHQPFKVGISASFRRDAAGLLEPVLHSMFQSFPFIQYEHFEDERVTPEAIRDFDATIAYAPVIGAEAFAGGVKTSVIARWGAGYDTIDVRECTAADVLLAIASDAVRKPMAEGIVALLLALAKRLPAKDAMVRSGRWDLLAKTIGIGLSGKIVGSVGLGNIGAEVFRLLGPFDLGRRLASDPYRSVAEARNAGVELVDIETVFRESDFVIMNCPLNAHTRDLVNAHLLSLMKPTSYFVNTARGGLVVEDDLVQALSEGRIAGAGLDVFAQEPLPLDSPLVRMENVVLAPHGIGYSDDMVDGNGTIACESVLAVLRGEIPRHVVNPEVLDRPGFQTKLNRLRRRWQALAGVANAATAH